MIPVNAPHPLSRLIQSIEDGQGWTDRQLSRRIARAGHSMSFSYIGKLKNHPIQSVTAGMVRALAAGLEIPETVVAIAALESMGVHIDTDSSAGLDVAITSEQSLTDYDKRLLRAVVKEMRTDGEERRGEDTAGNDSGPRVPSGPQPDGATTSHLKLERPWWQRENVAADQGVRELDAEDAEAGERGEGSQDPDDYR